MASSPPSHTPQLLWEPTQRELTTTVFMRNRLLFTTLAREIVPALREKKGKNLNILFLACSSGCEPYSLKFLLGPGAKDEIVGIDIDASAIQRARSGIYPPEMLSGFESQNPLLTGEERSLYFEPTVDPRTGALTIKDEYQSHMSFLKDDLFSANPMLPQAAYDLVLCNNLLLHLQPESADIAWDHIMKFVAPGGVVVVGGCNPSIKSKAAKRHALQPRLEQLTAIHRGWSGVYNAWQRDPRPLWAYPEPDENDPDYPYLAGEIFFTASRA